MAQVSIRMSVKGVDLQEMINVAKEQLADLGDITWTVDEIDLWGQEDVASKQGMMRLWSGNMTLKANIQA